jgi:NADH-quinone oxidoreductase subunit N
MLIAHGEDLFVIFLGIEIASLATFILTGFRKGDDLSQEASLKYFVLGSFASAFLLYGIALIYGLIGSTSLDTLSGIASPSEMDRLLLLLSVGFLLIGIGFKIAAVPFHFWSPDVYQGAPAPITAFLASAAKIGGVVVLIRLALALGHLPEIPWVPVIWGLSVATMTVGNLIALRQTNLKRLLAYSSIAHVGYLLVGLAASLKEPALGDRSLAAVLFYLFAYSLMTVGAFALVVVFSRRMKIEEGMDLSDFSGMAQRSPWLAAVLTLFLFSLIGIPPTIGLSENSISFLQRWRPECLGLL